MRVDPAATLSVLRTAVGAGSWGSPALSWRAFGLGDIAGSPQAALVTRLFGVRDLALGLAARHPDPAARRFALQVGVAADTVDVVATLLAVRAGASRPALVLVGGGAAFFAALGVAALAGDSVA